MNRENIQKVQEALARLMFTNHYNMGSWLDTAECGTTLCIGGIACILSLSLDNLNPSPNNLQENNFRTLVKPLFSESSLPVDEAVKQQAQRFLGLSYFKDSIFYALSWPRGLVALYEFTTARAIQDLDKYQANDLLYNFVSANPTLPRSFWRTLGGYLALQSLIDYGDDWKADTFYYSPSDFVSFNQEAVARFIVIAQELLAAK